MGMGKKGRPGADVLGDNPDEKRNTGAESDFKASHQRQLFSPPPRGISASGEVIVYLFIYLFIYSFLGPDLQHMEVPKARG